MTWGKLIKEPMKHGLAGVQKIQEKPTRESKLILLFVSDFNAS